MDMKVFDKFSEVLGVIANWMNSNKYLSTIKNAFTIYMPFIMIGSFASLFNTLLCSRAVGIASISAFAFLEKLGPAFSALNFACLSCMSIPITYLIGTELGRENGSNSKICGIIALISYLCCVPTFIEVGSGDAASIVSNLLPANSINAQGLFVGFIVGILSVELFCKLMTFDKIKIKMPESVPLMISNSFNSMIPAILTVFTITIASTLFKNITGMYLLDAIFKMIQLPLQNLAQQGWVAIVLIVIIPNLLWFLGIHGAMVMTPILTPLYVAALAENIAAVEAGGTATNVLTSAFLGSILGMGGNGLTLALIVSILLFSKREDYRMVAKMGVVPGIFGINEPVIFGLPIVLNPVFLLPFILAPCAVFGIAYTAISSGFVPCNTVDAPWGLPVIVRALVAYQHINVVWVCLLGLVVAFLIYTPFVFISNRLYEKERNQANS